VGTSSAGTPDSGMDGPVTVLSVEDNLEVAEAIRARLARVEGFSWIGSLASADELVAHAGCDRPSIVLLDIDMPGRDPFDALAELSARCPDVRTIVFTGHVRRDLIDRALDSGAWGYVSKNDGDEELVASLRKVAAGEFALGPEARRLYDTPSQEKRPRKTSVIVVDDSADLTELYRSVLEFEPDFECAGTLQDADTLVELVQERRPDLVLLDLSMPGRSPLEAAKEIAERFPATRVVFLSGYDDPETVRSLLDAGAWGLVSKHGTPPDVLSALRRVQLGEVVLPAR
jgi:DNA-binding NarL/FixJ family response regulator